MKHYIFFLLFLLILSDSFSQILFEKGYFVTNDSQRTECYIRNVDWKNNPKKFQYKLSQADEEQKTATIAEISEFGIYDDSKFIRAKVKIDRSPIELYNLSKSPHPEFSEEVLFLKVLLEGSASLYQYEEKSMKRYFFRLKDNSFTQLVYKEYQIGQNEIGENNSFRMQLFNKVNCGNVPMRTFERLNYFQSDLEKYFIKYNACMGDTIVTRVVRKRDFFNMRIVGGVNYNSLKLFYESRHHVYMDLGKSSTFRTGLQFEGMLPINRNKWGILFEPSYNYFYLSNRNGPDTFGIAKRRFIEFALGLRHYFFLNPDFKLFANVYVIPNLIVDINSFLFVKYPGGNVFPIDVVPGPVFGFGGGMEYKRLSAEVRFLPNGDLANRNQSWRTNFTRLSLTMGIKLF